MWFALVECVQAYVETGRGLTSIPGRPVDVELRRTAGGAVFGINGDRMSVDPRRFIPGLLDEADQYSRWVEEHIGTLDAPPPQRVAALQLALRELTA